MKKPELTAPVGACDCHIHIYELQRYPLASTATFGPPQASWNDYLQVRQALGLERAVIVQATGYGFDNRCALEALALSQGTARMIATLRADTPLTELRALHEAGVRGVRFMMIPNSGGVMQWEDLEPMAARIAELGWVINLQLDGRELPEYEKRLAALPCQVSLDHNGKYLTPVAPTDASFRSLLNLLERGHVWVKLSAPYETSRSGPPHYDDVSALASALAAANPDRCLWASNYPHPGRTDQPDNAAMLDLLAHWVPSEVDRRKVLTDNPAHLYGF
ncbi:MULTISPECIES: amidohydrolase family protein [unclassified Achromobacter]|uniref:amidohydrolase family protein n=1 Tax=unclassified Achromobacter TaxID=2626865 RepID=UPI000B516ADA|nr:MULTISPECIES: amidohydrolase family protein [unclassified Achromobacter]OWT75396.1 amidohydrolase [Achromobacter sp. HZ28]OWT76056.1 amidohydrolase [Achromobacter sp. HZ34]